MPIPLGILAVAGAGGAAAGAYEQISTQILTTTAASVNFSSIPSTYKHLQIRATMKSNSGTVSRVRAQVNGVTSASYASHNLRGTGAEVLSGNFTTANSTEMRDIGGFIPGTFFEGEANYSAMIMDVLDYTNTSKNTTFRSFNGMHRPSFTYVYLSSGVYLDTPAISSINLFLDSGSFIAGSRISLYGIRG